MWSYVDRREVRKEEIQMKKVRAARVLVAVSIALAAVAFADTSATARSEKAEVVFRAALQLCKEFADPGERDECVSNAHNRYEMGKKGETAGGGQATSGGGQDPKKGKGKKDKGKK
jgi:hypothetical protein